MKYLKKIIVTFLFFPALTLSKEGIHKLDVFYDSNTSRVEMVELAGVAIKYYQLDRAAILEEDINKLLPNSLAAASAFMGDYANSPEGKSIVREIVGGYQGVGLAYGLGIDKIPAVVINDQFVIYGTADAVKAIKYFKEKGRRNEAK